MMATLIRLCSEVGRECHDAETLNAYVLGHWGRVCLGSWTALCRSQLGGFWCGFWKESVIEVQLTWSWQRCLQTWVNLCFCGTAQELGSVGIRCKVKSVPEIVAPGAFSLIWFPSFTSQCSKDLIVLLQCGLQLFWGDLWIWSFNNMVSYAYRMSYSISSVYLIILCKLVIPGKTSVSCVSRYMEFSLHMEEAIHMQLSKR